MAEKAFAQTRYVLVVRVPRPIEVRIEDIYLHLAGTTKPVMGFHITLLGPFLFHPPETPGQVATQPVFGENQNTPTSDFVSRVRSVCRNWEPFSVRLHGLGVFKGQNDHLIYIQIAEPQTLIALHNELLKAVEGLITPQDERYRKWCVTSYQPHVTLGLGLTDRELEEFLHTGTLHPFDESFEVSGLWLAQQAPNGPWQYITEFPLGTSPKT